MALIELDHIVKTYDLGAEKVHALRDIHFGIERGEFVAIVGQSGSGKSTLMNIVGCLDVPTSGAYRLSGRDVGTLPDDDLADVRNQQIGFVFQSFQLLPRASALENVELPLIYRGIPARIARALVTEPSLLLADEPTGNLDSATGEEIVRLFLELHRAGNTIVLVTHEPKLAARCPRAVRLVDGLVVADGAGERVAFENTLDLERVAAAARAAAASAALTGAG